ncbi:hypothetical protein VTH8203_03083 [Vibrio thalassae]|uniref:Uncharacterized protein n=1 Tax=Vibrio thalassae TaxID=1243014 RepID=A0A240ELE6_9VIBR|nr:hypothetical protein [Vibrio thalassae]SNX49436.1 hypothetical protein VTH8203_03083 [Vibrio thalassae]
MKAPQRKDRIEDLLQGVAKEVHAYLHEYGRSTSDGWVSSVTIQKQLGLKHHCNPIGCSNDTPKSWVFSVIMRRLQDQGKVEYKKVGSRVTYRSRTVMH